MGCPEHLKLETQGEAIQPYMYREAQRMATYPLLLGKPAIKALIKYVLRKENRAKPTEKWMVEKNPLTDEQLKQDAKRWMDGWQKQFAIADFEAPLTEENQRGREYRIQLMRDLVDFCTERGYKPLYVIPPVTEYLAKEFTPKFQQIYIYDFLKQVERDVILLDYSKDKSLMDKDLYFNSFFMNRRGAKAFTKRVIKDLGI